MAQERILVNDLPALKPVLEQVEAIAVPARHVSFSGFLKLFGEEQHGKIRGAALAEGVTHVVCFENVDMWSSNAGHRTALIVGTKQTHTLETALAPGARLGDVPSRFQYPVAYASVKAVKKALPPQEKAPVATSKLEQATLKRSRKKSKKK